MTEWRADGWYVGGKLKNYDTLIHSKDGRVVGGQMWGASWV